MRRSRRDPLTEDDLEHWRRVARTARPLSTRETPGGGDPAPLEPRAAATVRTDAVAAAGPAHPLSSALRSSARGAFRIGAAAPRPGTAHDLKPDLGARLAAQPVQMDSKTFGRMRRGKLVPDRKLDLHGMTLAQAHPVLTRFVRRAHADGLRLLLVITGKGRSGADEGLPIPAPRGVLRHQVPLWLTSAPLRAQVLQVTDAHRRHGGTGAYYVYLRRGG